MFGDDDDEVIDVEGIEDDNIFFIIGNVIWNEGKVFIDKFFVFVENESFVIDEIVVFKGIKYKIMLLEYGFFFDS